MKTEKYGERLRLENRRQRAYRALTVFIAHISNQDSIPDTHIVPQALEG